MSLFGKRKSFGNYRPLTSNMIIPKKYETNEYRLRLAGTNSITVELGQVEVKGIYSQIVGNNKFFIVGGNLLRVVDFISLIKIDSKND